MIFSPNASAFNCRLTAFEKLDMSRVPPAWFPWQQQVITDSCIHRMRLTEDQILIKIFNIKIKQFPIKG